METRVIKGPLAERVIQDFITIFAEDLTERFSDDDLYHGHAVYEKPTRIEDYCMSESDIQNVIGDPSKLTILYHALELQNRHPKYPYSNIVSTSCFIIQLDKQVKDRLLISDVNELGKMRKWSPFQLNVVKASDGIYTVQNTRVNVEMTIMTDIRS